MSIKLGVVFGGASVEHEISIISALQAIENINQNKYEIIPIYIDKKKNWCTGQVLKDINLYKEESLLMRYSTEVDLVKKKNKFILQSKGLFKRTVKEIDLIFPIVHGANVEDGSLQGYLETIGIPYVGSNVCASAISQDKVLMKQILESAQIPIVKYVWFFEDDYYNDKTKLIKEIETLKYPVIVKPNSLGSSIGISFVKSKQELEEALTIAFNYDQKVIVEEVIPNLKEVNCSVLGDYNNSETSELDEIINQEEIFTYESKYIGKSKKGKSNKTKTNQTSRIIPANISKDLTNKIKTTSKEVFRVLNNVGVCRIDYLINTKTNKYYVNEINSIPGSLAFYLWEASGKSYQELLDEIITISIKQHKLKEKKLITFDTNILNYYNKDALKGNKNFK